MLQGKRSYLKHLLIILTAALAPISTARSPIIEPLNEPHISRIIINYDSLFYSSDKAVYEEDIPGGEIILSFRNNNIAFEISPENGFFYHFHLSGFDRDHATWQKSAVKEYTNIPPGHYRLNIRYKDSDENAGEMDPLFIRVLPAWYSSKPAFLAGVILALLAIWALYESLGLRYAEKLYWLEQIINKRTEDLIIEKEKTESLLANVLPKNTADEIMAKGKAAKIKYNFVTVLFSDIQGFTQIAEEMNPEVLIDELDKFFFHFDSVVEKYGIEKIKTIGDAYMCAGGIPEKNRTNPVEVILAALEMQQYMARLKESSMLQGMKYWDIRIGIHTGPIVAGVIGHKKLSYDIWGDTVNTASRMESSGEAGRINISGTTYEFVKDFFICDHRGKMPVKYKGEIDMYFVRGIQPGLSDGNDAPNQKFLLRLLLLSLEDVEDKAGRMFEEEAPPNLYFHNTQYAGSVNGMVDLLASAENISDDEFVDLKLASIFLFTGYITDYDNPVQSAFNLLEELLPHYGFDEKHAERVRRLIYNSFHERYESRADMILHDARYSYLGSVDYIILTDKLFKETTEHGNKIQSMAWIESQKKLLTDHDFLTASGRLLRSVSIEDQIEKLQVYDR